MIRKSINEDVSRILELCRDTDYESDPFRDILSDRVIIDGEKLIAYGAIKRFTEAVLVLDKSKNVRTKIKALKELLNAAYFETRKVGLTELHVFTKNDSFANILRKHFGFLKIEGTALVKELNG
jgi:N-acetylglutamate synthase-like GNAT family acetyltransferase